MQGPLGLVPGSHLWEAGNGGPEYTGANMGKIPGHVKVAVPAGAMVLFDMSKPSTALFHLSSVVVPRWNAASASRSRKLSGCSRTHRDVAHGPAAAERRRS